MDWVAVRTFPPEGSRPTVISFGPLPPPPRNAAFTWGREARFVRFNRRVGSGWMIRVPSASTAYASPAFPTLIPEITSRISFRVTSATTTPPDGPSRRAIFMCGSDSFTKNTGLK